MLAFARSLAPRVALPMQTRCCAGASGIFGCDTWRYDKNAYKQFVLNSAKEGTPESRQLYGHIALGFGDVDVDKDGWINDKEFDRLVENMRALPRRFGLQPSWRVKYENDVAKRTAARKTQFDAIDGAFGPPRGKIAMAQFVKWSRENIFSAKAIDVGRVDVAHANLTDGAAFIEYLDKAVNDKTSKQSTSFYHYLLTIYVEADKAGHGRLNFEGFCHLLDLASEQPRAMGLAPKGVDEAVRKAMFDAMDVSKTGTITFRKFLRFTRLHVREKVAMVKATAK